MRVFGCFGGTPEKERIQSLRTDSPLKSQKAHRNKRGLEKDPPAILEQAFVTEDDMGRCIRSEEDFSDITLAVRPGGTSLGSCGSTNLPLKNAAAGVLAWAHVDALAEEVADLRRRLCEEEANARRLAEEVVTLRSNGGDSGEDSQPSSERSDRSNWSRVRYEFEFHAMDPQLHSSQRDGQFGHSRNQIGLKKSSTNESTDEPTDDDRAQPLSEPDEAEEAGIRIPWLPAAMVPSDGVASDKGVPMPHTEGQWEETMRQGSPSWTSGGRKSLSPRQRKRAMGPPSSAPPNPTAGNFQERDAVLRDDVSQESASLRMGINSESEDSGDSNGSVGIQNLPEAEGSESSFALAPPISAPGAIDLLDSPTMEPKRGAHELSLPTPPESKVTEGCAELDLNSTPHYTHVERGESLRRESSPAMPVDETAREGNKEGSCNPMASPTWREEVEVAAPWNHFPGRLHHNLSASQIPDSINSPDLRDFISHTSPLFINEDVDVRSDVTDSSSESRRLGVSHLLPESELPSSPHTEDMLQVHLNDAEMSFDNPVYAYDV